MTEKLNIPKFKQWLQAQRIAEAAGKNTQEQTERIRISGRTDKRTQSSGIVVKPYVDAYGHQQDWKIPQSRRRGGLSDAGKTPTD